MKSPAKKSERNIMVEFEETHSRKLNKMKCKGLWRVTRKPKVNKGTSQKRHHNLTVDNNRRLLL